MNGKNAAFSIWLAALIASAILFIGCNDQMGGLGLGGDSEAPSVLTGRAILEKENNFAGIKVEMVDLNLSMITDSDGYFVLPENMTEGEWTISGAYPYFNSASGKFAVTNGLPEGDLPVLKLKKLVEFDVSCDKKSYALGETVYITLVAENVSDSDVTLASPTSPQTTFAVRYGNTVVAGSLLSGTEPQPSYVTLAPHEPVEFEMSWTLDDSSLFPGVYDVYAIVTTSQTHQAYFDPDPEAMAKFNSTLFDKLTPAKIKIVSDRDTEQF